MNNVIDGNALYAQEVQYYYENISDEIMVKLSREGNQEVEEALIERYRRFVKGKARSYFLIGADRDDIIQEGMIGLYKAIRDYNIDRQASFKAFADMCIKRQIITAIKSATRQKHIPLNSYISLDKPVFEENSERTLMDILTSDKVTDPETITVFKEELDYIESKLAHSLSKLEWKVLRKYVFGKSYLEISEELGRPMKSVDNALQRVKRKLESYMLSLRV